MPLSQKDFEFPRIIDAAAFETFCLDLWKRILKTDNLSKYGKNGQKQSGVDLVGTNGDSLDWVGIQCKVRNNKLSMQDISNDISRAKELNPSLTKLIFATTAPRDKTLQDAIRQLSGLPFEVQIKFWDDIKDEIDKDENADLRQNFYGDNAIAKIKYGHLTIARVLSLSIGIEESVDTGYELLLGKIAQGEKPESSQGLNYWKGAYYIVNLNDRRMETFSLRVFETDIEEAFRFPRDRYLICEWLNSLKSIDEVIKGTAEKYTFSISKTQFQSWLASRL